MKKTIAVLICLFAGLQASEADEAAFKHRVCAIVPSLEGWCSQEKALNFIDLVFEVKPKICVEIGVFGGSSLFPVASALKFLGEGVVIGIDPWDLLECIKYFDPITDAVNLKWWGSVNLDYIKYRYWHMLTTYKLEDYCVTIPLTSEAASSQIASPIDILHIDGNHSRESSIQDVSFYLPKVRSKGYIWITDAIWPERQDAIDLLLESADVIKVIDNGNCILFRKR